jgi:hypothetical protein
MNDIEDRLRDAYQAVERAIRPETIRPRVLPAGSTPNRFVPLAAAAAVIAVIAGAVTVPRLLTHSPRATPGATSSAAVSTAAESHYLADLVAPLIELRDPATGKVLSRTPPPAGSSWQALAAIDGGTKFLLETAGDPCNGGEPFKIYSLTPGKPDSLKPYMTLPGFIQEFTASADGRTLAYLTDKCRTGQPPTSLVGVVRHGVTRDWTVPSSVNPGSLSLSADGSELGYVNFTTQGQRGTVSALATSSPSGSLARWSRPVYVPVRHGQQAQALVLSPDGRTTYLLTAPAIPSSAMTETLYAYDTSTGTRLRTLHAWHGVQGAPPRMVADGVHALLLGMHLTSIDEVNLATGAARWFQQLRDGTGDVLAIAW